MRKIFLLLSAVLLLAGCSREADKPQNLLAKETMVGLMVDMQIAEAKVKNLRVSTDSARHLFSIYELAMFHEKNISPEQYKASYEYYLNQYEEMKAIQKAVVDTLNQRQQRLK